MRRRPGDLLLSPWAIGAIVLLVVNDHVLKWRFGGVLTGKLSDVAGVFLLPLLTLAIVEVGLALAGRPWLSGRGRVIAHVAVTGVGFTAVKTVGPVGDAYEHAVGALRKAVTFSADPVAPILVYRDATDLVVLPVLALTFLAARRAGRAVSRGASRRRGTPARATAGC